MRTRICALLALAAVSAACGGSPSGPSDSPPANVLEGHTVNVLDGAATAGLTVSVGHDKSSTTDGNGYFKIDVGGDGAHWLTVYGAGVVNRETMISGLNGQPARVSLIPASFDLNAFDEMFRSSSKLLRWTERPALVVLGSVMTYSHNGSDRFTATSERISDGDLAAVVAHLEEGLALLTADTFTTFSSVETEHPAAGEQVSVQRSGAIVVGRYRGVQATGAIGYGQWAESASGAVVGGSMFLDDEFDRRDGRRRLLRIHELGHALGYGHVTSRDSIMNPMLGSEVMEFDRSGATIAFQRPPGNRSPDSDGAAGGATQNAETGATTYQWSDRIPCGRR